MLRGVTVEKSPGSSIVSRMLKLRVESFIGCCLYPSEKSCKCSDIKFFSAQTSARLFRDSMGSSENLELEERRPSERRAMRFLIFKLANWVAVRRS